MRIAFESSHVGGDNTSGQLTVGIGVEDDRFGQTTWIEIEFSVPPDFHAHNDAVAAAFMTLAGRRYSEVSFNFPISAYCAETLRAYYGEIAFDPVDPAAMPRRPGTRVGLNFSGGVDSVANWLLLRELYADDFAVITSEYGGLYEYEARGYSIYPRDVSCRTNLRDKRFDRRGRFNFCVPLLFADYLDLGAIVTGHTVAQTPDGVADYRGVERPAFLHGDLVVNAGGLEDIHLLRSLTSTGVAKIVMTLGPECIERALDASSASRESKRYLNAAIFRHLYNDADLPLPPYLENGRPLEPRMRRFEHALRLLYIFKREGAERVCRICPKFAQLDLAVLDAVRCDFLGRYNPRTIEVLAEPLRSRVVEIFERCGVGPYDARDWEDLAVVRRQFKAHFPRYANIPD
jgi:hypothetical protein